MLLGLMLPLLTAWHSCGQTLTTAIRITPFAGLYSQPAISGDTVVWFDARLEARRNRVPGVDLYARNLRTGRQIRVTSSPVANPAASPMVNHGTVVWDDCRHCRPANGLPGYSGDRLLMRNLATGREVALPIAPGVRLGPWLLSGLAVWGQSRGKGSMAFYAADAVNGRTKAVATDPVLRRMLSARIHLVAWSDGSDIRGGDLLTGCTFIVARHASSDDSLSDPIMSGRRVIWTRWPRQGPVSVDGVDLNTGRRFHVITLPANHYDPQFGPDKTIHGAVVVWVQTRNPISWAHPDYTVMARDLASSQRLPVSVGQHGGEQPAVSGNRLVYVQPIVSRRRGTTLIVQTGLPASTTSLDPIWPMQVRGGG